MILHIHPIHFITLAAGVIDLILAVLIWIRNSQKAVNRSFSIFIFVVGIWVLLSFFLDSRILGQWPTPMFFIKGVLAPAIVLPLLFVKAVKDFSREKMSRKSYIALLVPAALMMVFVPTSANVIDVHNNPLQTQLHAGWLYIPFSIYFVIAFGYALKKMYKIKKQEKGYIQWQANIILWSVGIAATMGIIYDGLLAILDQQFLMNFGPIIATIVTMSLSYALIRYRFTGIDIRIGKKRIARKIKWHDLPEKFSFEKLSASVEESLSKYGLKDIAVYIKDQDNRDKIFFFEPRTGQQFELEYTTFKFIEQSHERLLEDFAPHTAFQGAFKKLEVPGKNSVHIFLVQFNHEVSAMIRFTTEKPMNTFQKNAIFKMNNQLYININSFFYFKNAL